MVAGVGNVDMEPEVTARRKDVIGREQRFRAKKAAILARKRVDRTPKFITNHRPKNECEEEKPSEERKTKKRKKFQPAPWLCGDMTVDTSLRIRSDVHDATELIAGSVEKQDFDEYDLDEIEVDMLYWNRRNKRTMLSLKMKNLSLANFVTKRKLDDAIQRVGNNVVVKSDALSRLVKQDSRRSYAKEQVNAKTSANLKRLGLKRRHEIEPKKVDTSDNPSTHHPKTNYAEKKGVKPTNSRKPRWTVEQRERRIHVPHEYELHNGNVDCADPAETDLVCFLMDLQNREMTPEDYDMLLRLDDKVAPKTTAAEKLASLRTETVLTESDDRWRGELCPVCMEAYEHEQIVKYLPCDHFFHSNCIEMWLKNSGNRCPLDGSEV